MPNLGGDAHAATCVLIRNSEPKSRVGLAPGGGLATVDWSGRFIQLESVGGRLMNRSVFALFGVVAVLLSATVALTLSRATLFAGGVGSLKCYDKGGIEKAC
jgi:hypothetical protein